MAYGTCYEIKYSAIFYYQANNNKDPQAEFEPPREKIVSNSVTAMVLPCTLNKFGSHFQVTAERLNVYFDNVKCIAGHKMCIGLELTETIPPAHAKGDFCRAKTHLLKILRDNAIHQSQNIRLIEHWCDMKIHLNPRKAI